MASHVCGLNEILEELLVVLDSMQVAIYIDANSSKNLPILKKYLASAVLPIAGISKEKLVRNKVSVRMKVLRISVMNSWKQLLTTYVTFSFCQKMNNVSS